MPPNMWYVEETWGWLIKVFKLQYIESIAAVLNTLYTWCDDQTREVKNVEISEVGLMITASHQTFSGQIKHQIKFGQTNLLYVINGEVNEFAMKTVNKSCRSVSPGKYV